MNFADRAPYLTWRLKEPEENSNSKQPGKQPVIPERYAMSQNFPNPFNPVTHITVDLPQESRVSLTVYNVTGQKVAELLRGVKPAGIYEVVFDGSNLASGVYIYRLQANDFTAVKRMLLVK